MIQVKLPKLKKEKEVNMMIDEILKSENTDVAQDDLDSAIS